MFKWIKGLFVGGLLGFLGGLFLAPKSGDETRGKLKDALDKGAKFVDDVKQSWTVKEK